jgi:enoyl-CoA hydratase/carnithine racemase
VARRTRAAQETSRGYHFGDPRASGRARGAGSEFVLATDIRFASRERAILAQMGVGFGSIPGGGPAARLPDLVGRGRALEILLGGEDFDGELARAKRIRQPRRTR